MSSNLKVNTILPSVGSNIGLGTNGGNLNVDGGCKVQVGTALTLGHTVGVQFATQNLHSAGFEVNNINATGIITASQFKGDGSNLTGISGVSIANQGNDRLITATGTTDALNAEANLTYNGNHLQFNTTANGHGVKLVSTGNYYNKLSMDSGATSANAFLNVIDFSWDGDKVADIVAISGSDTTNKDDGHLVFRTSASQGSITERLRINSYGQVGINTSVGGQLAIAMDSSNTNPLATGFIALSLKNTNTTDNTSVCMDFNNSVGGIVGRFGAQFKDTSDKNTDLYFATRSNGGALAEALRITSDGNVGLGTATPQNSSGYATLTCSGSTGGQIAFFGGTRRHYIWANSSGNLNIGGGYVGGGDVRIYTNGNNERLRIDSGGHAELRNSGNSHQELRWYVNNTKSASIGWGNGSANWEFKHFRNDNQADNPYANIDFFTGDFSNPTRALRITNDGNHIREKHSRFATRIDYNSGNESAHAKLPFKSAHVNVGGDYSDSNDRFTAPVDGSYAFWFYTNVERGSTGSYYATWYVNGSEANGSYGGRMYDQHSGSGWNNLSGCIMLPLQEGDYVEVYNGSQVVNYDGNSYGQWMGWLVG